MAMSAWIVGILGGLCAVMGIVTAAEVEGVPSPGPAFTEMFWLVLSVILLLACIAFATGRSRHEEYE